MRLFILFNSVFHACALKNSYVYFRSIRSAWIPAECTWIRCSAVESRYVTGFRRPSRSNGARIHIFSGPQTGKYVDPGSVHAQSPADSDGAISFLSRAADPGAFCCKKPSIFIPKSACTSQHLPFRPHHTVLDLVQIAQPQSYKSLDSRLSISRLSTARTGGK